MFEKTFGVCTILCAAFAMPAHAIDLDELRARGEIYVVALYSGLTSEAGHLSRAGEKDAAAFLRGRANAIEAGSEVFPFHPTGFSSLTAAEERALMRAYEETYALVGSEAADMAPEQIAAVQIAYEKWLFRSAEGDGDGFAEGRGEWSNALRRFIAWSEGGTRGPDLAYAGDLPLRHSW